MADESTQPEPNGEEPPPSSPQEGSPAPSREGSGENPPPPPPPPPEQAPEAQKSEEKAPAAEPAPVGPSKDDKKSRKHSMFQEADDFQALVDTQNQGGDLTTTLQNFFAYQSLSQEAVSTQKPLRRPKLVFQNTYRLESLKPFSPTRVEAMMNITMAEILENVRYNSKTVNTTCAALAEKIRARLLTYRYDRYKLIVMVTIGSMTRQGIHIGFRNLWDPTRDNYACATFKNVSIFAAACVYAVYFE